MAKIILPGKPEPVEATQVEIKESTERWTEAKLEDGSVLKIKAVLIKAFRTHGIFDEEGNPVYQLKVNQVMSVSAPDHLKKNGAQEDVH